VPVLDVIEKSGLSDTAIVVTRYFGGTLLGAAGLIRSYGKAASLAVAAAGIVVKSLANRIAILVEYQLANIVRNMLDKNGVTVVGVSYGTDVEITVVSLAGDVAELRARVTELTAGSAAIEQTGYLYIDSPIA